MPVCSRQESLFNLIPTKSLAAYIGQKLVVHGRRAVLFKTKPNIDSLITAKLMLPSNYRLNALDSKMQR